MCERSGYEDNLKYIRPLAIYQERCTVRDIAEANNKHTPKLIITQDKNIFIKKAPRFYLKSVAIL